MQDKNESLFLLSQPSGVFPDPAPPAPHCSGLPRADPESRSPSPPPGQPQGLLHEGWLVTAVTQSFPTGPVGQCEDMPYGNERERGAGNFGTGRLHLNLKIPCVGLKNGAGRPCSQGGRRHLRVSRPVLLGAAATGYAWLWVTCDAAEVVL